MQRFGCSQRQALRILRMTASTYLYVSQRRDESVLKARIKEITDTRVHYGYRRVHVMLRRKGHVDNVKRVYRLYREEGLSLRLKRPRRNKAAQRRQPKQLAHAINEIWSMDFVADALFDGRKLRMLTVVDLCQRRSKFPHGAAGRAPGLLGALHPRATAAAGAARGPRRWQSGQTAGATGAAGPAHPGRLRHRADCRARAKRPAGVARRPGGYSLDAHHQLVAGDDLARLAGRAHAGRRHPGPHRARLAQDSPQGRVDAQAHQGRLSQPRRPPFHADGGHFGYDLSITQDTRATCPPSPGTLSAMEMESLSAISGMRSSGVLPQRPRRCGHA